jgi:2,3-bisphosphoglycerate-independent phosphoglycerate mutase
MKTTILTILDGWGQGRPYEGNAIFKGNTPNFDRLIKEYPHTSIKTSGLDVGLPPGQMGNSEVGHMNIGAGRIVYQELTRITQDLEMGNGKNNLAFKRAFDNVKNHGSKLHIMGLVSNGGVHSHNEHIYQLIRLANEAGVEEIFLHCFMDGRDVPPTSGSGFIGELERQLTAIGKGKIATVMGRYYAMDRDNRWERTQEAYLALTESIGYQQANAVEGIEASYAMGVTDEFIRPIIVDPQGKIENHDSIIFVNFRPDRARQLTRAFVDVDFKGFERDIIETEFVTMTQYDVTIKGVSVAYEPQYLNQTLGEVISNHGLKQLRLAETEKYAHVTFFFNGGVEPPVVGEDRLLIPSPKVATYDMKPEMSAYEVKEAMLEQLKREYYDLVVLNFANADMVGHTGDLEATIKAIETVDQCIGEISHHVIEQGYNMIITADHGNAEEMIDESKQSVLTQHSTNEVPLILVTSDPKITLREGRLADIAPTLLTLMGIDKPEEMTGRSIIKIKDE